MVILLIQHGADPALIDGEGFSSIHLAVLFQHMPIIAYLISKGQVCFELSYTPAIITWETGKIISDSLSSFLKWKLMGTQILKISLSKCVALDYCFSSFTGEKRQVI